jgi:hypothetical protein
MLCSNPSSSKERERERERDNARYNHTEKPLHPRWTKHIGYFQELSNYIINTSRKAQFINSYTMKTSH